MPLRLDAKRRLLARSDRVKSVDLHPTESWMLVSLYNGNVHIWNYENQQLVKSFEICELPVRAAKFVTRKNWIVTGSDDMNVRVYNWNTMERLQQFEAHSDYIRAIAVHPTEPYVLTCSDDMLVKLWDFGAGTNATKWANKQTFEGHTHYVMQVVINPKDNNTFATASLDRTIKVWQFGSSQPNFTLEGHEKGVNCVDYYHGGDKPYLISGADDRQVRIWDYQNKTCVATLEGHAQNVTAVAFHPELPIILTGSEDATVRVWHANTHRLETTLNYGLERVWAITAQKGTNTVAIGYDEGSVLVTLGREEPAVSMDNSGKILWARHSEIQQANLKQLGEASSELNDGERVSVSVKEMGSCEIYPQTLQHSSNGRFVVACGDGEYIIYTAMALRNKAYGAALEFAWATTDANVYAIRENATQIKLFKNFKESRQLKLDYGVEGIHGGAMLGVRAAHSLCFYEWESLRLVRRIELSGAKTVVWNDAATLVAVNADDVVFLLKFSPEAVELAKERGTDVGEDGVEESFEVVGELQESVKTSCWVGDCFVFTTKLNRLQYYVGGEVVSVAHLDRPLHLLGYIPSDSRLYLLDKEHNLVSYKLLLSVLEYQTAVMRRDFTTADKVLTSIPKEQRSRVANFLEKQGFRKQALAVSLDPDHRFDLALALGELSTAYQLAVVANSEEKWKLLSQAATARSDLLLAGECLGRAKDYAALLLLASSAGSETLMSKLAGESKSDGQNNVAFMASLMLGDIDACLDLLIEAQRLPEAAFFARTYAPSRLAQVVSLWKEKMSTQQGQKLADSVADPVRYPNLFAGVAEDLKAEQYLRQLARRPIPAAAYHKLPSNSQRNVIDELKKGEESGALKFDEAGQLIDGGLPVTPKAPPSPPRKARTPTPPPPQQFAHPEPQLDQPFDEPDEMLEEEEEEEKELPQPTVCQSRPDIAQVSKPDLVPPAPRGPDIATVSAASAAAQPPELVKDAEKKKVDEDDFDLDDDDDFGWGEDDDDEQGDEAGGSGNINLDDLDLDEDEEEEEGKGKRLKD